MNFLTVKQAAFRRLQVSETQTGDFNTRIGAFVNRWHRQILSEPGLRRQSRKTQVTLATVADQWRYGVKLAAIDYITERSNERRLRKRTESWWREHFADPTSETGDADFWVPLGYTRVKQRPANASEIFAVSTSASDTQTISVEVVRSNGARRLLSVSLTGVTGVSLAAAITDVVDVLDVYLASAAVGQVTLREDSGAGTVLSEIDIGEVFPRYTQIALAPTPSSVQTLYVDGGTGSTDLVDDTDEPLLPEDFHYLLADGAVYEEWLAHGRIKEAQWLRDEIQKGIARLRSAVWSEVFQDEAEGVEPFGSEERFFKLPLT